jgi:putative transposase
VTGYRVFHGEDIPYFVTSTVVGWAHAFTSTPYFEIVRDALAFGRSNKGLRIYGYVIMPNHIHLIGQAERGRSLSALIRDFKRQTSRALLRKLEADGRESLVTFFRSTPLRRPGNTEAKVWQDGFHPIAVEDHERFLQKLEYLELNPVRKGCVDEPEHWRYSSARNRLNGDHSVLEIDSIEG